MPGASARASTVLVPEEPLNSNFSMNWMTPSERRRSVTWFFSTSGKPLYSNVVVLQEKTMLTLRTASAGWASSPLRASAPSRASSSTRAARATARCAARLRRLVPLGYLWRRGGTDRFPRLLLEVPLWASRQVDGSPLQALNSQPRIPPRRSPDASTASPSEGPVAGATRRGRSEKRSYSSGSSAARFAYSSTQWRASARGTAGGSIRRRTAGRFRSPSSSAPGRPVRADRGAQPEAAAQHQPVVLAQEHVEHQRVADLAPVVAHLGGQHRPDLRRRQGGRAHPERARGPGSRCARARPPRRRPRRGGAPRPSGAWRPAGRAPAASCRSGPRGCQMR